MLGPFEQLSRMAGLGNAHTMVLEIYPVLAVNGSMARVGCANPAYLLSLPDAYMSHAWLYCLKLGYWLPGRETPSSQHILYRGSESRDCIEDKICSCRKDQADSTPKHVFGCRLDRSPRWRWLGA